MKHIKTAVIGQEAVCPDGLGRVFSFDKDYCVVRTYYNNRDCKWAWENIRLIKLNYVEDRDYEAEKKRDEEYQDYIMANDYMNPDRFK